MTLSPQFLEGINLFLLIEFLAVLYLFSRYIAQGIYNYGWKDGYRRRSAAIGVSVLIFGDAMIRAFVWLWRHRTNEGNPPGPEFEQWLTIGTTAGVVIAAIGCACVLRQFSPDSWGEYPWVTTMILGAAIAIFSALT